MKAALIFPGYAGAGPDGSSEGPHCMKTWFSFTFHALGTTGDKKNHLVYQRIRFPGGLSCSRNKPSIENPKGFLPWIIREAFCTSTPASF